MPRNSFMLGAATPRKIPSSVTPNGPDWTMALLAATIVRRQTTVRGYAKRENRFCEVNFCVKIKAFSFRGSGCFRSAPRCWCSPDGNGANYISAEVAAVLLNWNPTSLLSFMLRARFALIMIAFGEPTGALRDRR